MQQTTDGGYILGGTSNSGISGDKSQANKGPFYTYDYWLVKITATGSKTWDKTYGGNASDIFKSVLQTSDGGYILGGNSNSGKGGDKSEANKSEKPQIGDIASNFWIIKLNANGNKAWDKTIGSNGGENFAALQPTPDGGYILGGSSASAISGDKTENNKGNGLDYWVVKLKEDGSVAWDKSIGGNLDDELQSIAQTNDGNFILAGASTSNKSGDKSADNKGPALNFGYYTTDYWLVKIDNSGTNLSQYITLEPVPAKHVGDAPFTLEATASSGLPVTLKAVSGPVKIKDNVITITGVATRAVSLSSSRPPRVLSHIFLPFAFVFTTQKSCVRPW